MTAAGTAVRQERRSRATGTTVQVLDLAHPDSPVEPDEGNRWGTLCVEHAGFCSHPTIHLARAHAVRPDGWCPWCSGEAELDDTNLGGDPDD